MPDAVSINWAAATVTTTTTVNRDQWRFTASLPLTGNTRDEGWALAFNTFVTDQGYSLEEFTLSPATAPTAVLVRNADRRSPGEAKKLLDRALTTANNNAQARRDELTAQQARDQAAATAKAAETAALATEQTQLAAGLQSNWRAAA